MSDRASSVEGIEHAKNGNPRLLGVLVTYRRPIECARTLDRLAAQTVRLHRLVTVDNGKDPEVASLLASRHVADQTDYVAPESNIGPAGGFALGMQRLIEDARDCDWIVLLDDDDPPFYDDAFEKAMNFADRMIRRDPTTGAVGISGGRFDLKRGRVIRVGDDELTGPVSVDHITAGGLPTYRVSAVREIGVMAPELFFGFEELEYGRRMSEAGLSLYADGDAWLARKKDKRSRGLLPPEEIAAARKASMRVEEPSWRRYYSLRNLIYLLRKAGATRTALRVAVVRGLLKPSVNLLLRPRDAGRLLRFNLAAVRDGWRGRMGMTVDNPTPIASATVGSERG